MSIDLSTRRSSQPRRGRPRIAALSVLAVAVLGATAVGPAQAMHPPDHGKGGFVTVYHTTYAYSTPSLAYPRHLVRPGTYLATCEAYSSSTGRYYHNHWWSRTNEGTWINNGDLRGGVKMGIGDC